MNLFFNNKLFIRPEIGVCLRILCDETNEWGCLNFDLLFIENNYFIALE